jgi:hypothetical protein
VIIPLRWRQLIDHERHNDLFAIVAISSVQAAAARDAT